jgi:DNA-binding transcriptional ArsR family regulator
LIWDCGTAYDMFVSLYTLHHPAKYGLRGAWAKGVRSRLPPAEREILKQAQGCVLSPTFIWGPMHWIHTLPAPKDGATVLRALEQVPPTERLPTLALISEMPPDLAEILQGVAARRAWDERDQKALEAVHQCLKSTSLKKEEMVNILEWWSRPQEFGERYLDALRAYQEVFFAKEEARILPALREALAKAQALAGQLTLADLLEELSQGLRLVETPQVPELVLAPSFWSTPLLVLAQVSAERELILFGARPPDASLVPGEVVPEALIRALKALRDPTRLRILRYLAAEPQTPAQLARRLRLRAPTVVHHLHTLRLAGLVHLTLGKEDKRRYAARPEAVTATLDALKAFLESGEAEASETAN